MIGGCAERDCLCRLLTYMATLSALVIGGDLNKYDPDLPLNELEVRTLLASDRAAAWISQTLATLPSDLDTLDSCLRS